MTLKKIGRIVWHDLFTDDRPRSMAFYRALASWSFVTEHATEFAWGGGEKDFVLAFAQDEVGAGIAETPQEHQGGWIAYVEVEDVDRAALAAEKLGGTVVRQPFDVPGVGRNCLLRDPFGALLGICVSSHSYPVQERQFGIEGYLSPSADFPSAFYTELFGWVCERNGKSQPETTISLLSNYEVAERLGQPPQEQETAFWIPSILVPNAAAALHDIERLGGKRAAIGACDPDRQSRSICYDPNGAMFFLWAPES